MSRLPMIRERAGLSARQQEVYDALVATRGKVGGAFGILLHRPELAGPAQELGAQLRFHSRLDPLVREAVQVAVSVMARAEYEIKAHERLALAAGMRPADLALLLAGRFAGLEGDLGLAVGFAEDLIVRRRVTPESFARLRERWDDESLVELACLVGYYSLIGVVLDAFEVEPA